MLLTGRGGQQRRVSDLLVIESPRTTGTYAPVEQSVGMDGTAEPRFSLIHTLPMFCLKHMEVSHRILTVEP